MGRLWQTLILSQWKSELAYLPVESVIRDQQSHYYDALRQSDMASSATFFVEFMLKALSIALQQALMVEPHIYTQSSEKGSEKGSDKGSEKTTIRILDLIEGDPDISAKRIAEKLDISARAVEKNIAKLKASGCLIRVGAARGGYWQVNR